MSLVCFPVVVVLVAVFMTVRGIDPQAVARTGRDYMGGAVMQGLTPQSKVHFNRAQGSGACPVCPLCVYFVDKDVLIISYLCHYEENQQEIKPDIFRLDMRLV